MNRKLLVSVIIPHFNREDKVWRSIQSVILQSYKLLEIIVIDDGSDDQSLIKSIVSSFNDPRLRLVLLKENVNGAAARNIGIVQSNGELIAFLDSDDEWMPKKIETQIEYCKNFVEEDVLVFTKSDVRTQEGQNALIKIWPNRGLHPNEKIGDYLFCNRGYLPTPSIMVPRRLAIEVPFNEKLQRHQDYDFLLRLEEKGCQFHMIKEPLVIVHWEDMQDSARGLNPTLSLAFLKDYHQFLSPRARSGFVISQIVLRLQKAGRKGEAIKYAIVSVRPWHLSLVEHISFISELIFGDARLSVMMARLKQRLLDQNTG